MTTDNFIEAAEAASWEDDRHPDDVGAWSRMKFMRGAEWARDYLAAQGPQVTIRHEEGEPSTCEVRQGGVLIFSGRDHNADLRIARAARRDEEGLGDAKAHHFSAPLDYLNDARRDEEKRAACGCDLTGPVPPAVHIVDRHEERR